MYYGCSTQPNSRATVSFPCMYVRTYIYTKGEPQRHRLAHVQGLNACATSTVGRTPTSMLRRPPGVGVDCAHATPTIQKETLETPFHPDTHPGRSRRRCACTVRGGGACEHTRTSGITCAALAGMLHGRALTGTGTSVVPGIATRSLSHAATPRRGSVRVQGRRAGCWLHGGGDGWDVGRTQAAQRCNRLEDRTRSRSRPCASHNRAPASTGAAAKLFPWHRATLNNSFHLHVTSLKNKKRSKTKTIPFLQQNHHLLRPWLFTLDNALLPARKLRGGGARRGGGLGRATEPTGRSSACATAERGKRGVCARCPARPVLAELAQ